MASIMNYGQANNDVKNRKNRNSIYKMPNKKVNTNRQVLNVSDLNIKYNLIDD